jgi:hypothetical protein
MRRPARALTLPSLLSALLLGSALLFGLAVAPATAEILEAGSGTVKVGAQPRSTNLLYGPRGRGPAGQKLENPAVREFGNPTGAPVLPSSRTYAIYWDPTDSYHGDWQELVNGFFQRMSGKGGIENNVFTVDAQYTDKANQHASYNTTFMGAYTDVERYPAETCTAPGPLVGETFPEALPAQITCLTDAQVQEQLKTFIAQHALPTGMGTIFYLLTPPGVTVCLDAGGPKGHCSDYKEGSLESYTNSFCSYHSDVNPTEAVNGDASTILYAVIPWITGNWADGHLEDWRFAFDCQDGGYDPSSAPEAEKHEEKKEKTKQQEEQEAKTEETKEQEEAQERQELLEGPHEQEPNQPTSDGPDGYADTGLADLIVNQVAVEQQNTVTDPLLNAWQDPSGKEATDECRNYFAKAGPLNGSVSANEVTAAGTLSNQTLGGSNYYLNDAFSLAALRLPYPGVPCVPGIELVPHFTSPNPVNSGEVVGLNGMESDITLNWGTEYSPIGVPTPTYAVYKWNFGDGTPEVSGYAPGAPFGNPSLCEEPWKAPCAASVFHSYQYGGTYEVTLTVTDTGGNTASVKQPLTVVGPPPPAPPPPGETPGAPGPGGSPATVVTPPPAPTPSGVGSGPVEPGPIAAAAAIASSLRQVAKHGLVVHYRVNEQVAGRFEVLLPASTARSLGIGGRVATNLPAGYPKSLVIGQALLVTTKGGHSSVRIKFAKRVARHLKRARKVTLTLRLKVRNASKSPLFTTVMSTVVLHR